MRACVVIAVFALASVRAAAQVRPELPELEQVRQLEASLEYEKALVLADQTIARGGLYVDDLAKLHFEAGKLAAGLDHADAAADHFAKALELEPSLTLPAGTSPKISVPFQDVRARAQRLKVDVSHTASGVSVAVDDAVHLVVQVQVSVHDDVGHTTRLATNEGPPFVFALPMPARDVKVIALDEHDNHVFEQDEGTMSWTITHAPPRPWYTKPITWIGVATVALAGAGGFSAWRESVAQDEWNRLKNDTMPHDFSELRAIEDRGRNWALAANISFGIAGTGALLLGLAWASGHAGSDPASQAIAITAGPGAIGVAGRF